MGGRSFRVPDLEVATWWTLHVDGWGQHRIRDAEGFDPLRHPDGLTRLRNYYLVSNAKPTRYGFGQLLQRVARSSALAGHRDDPFLAWCWDVLHAGTPLAVEELKVREVAGQVEAYFEDAA